MDNFSPNQCLKCGKPLTGRSDKKFCDAYCRNSFNNENKSHEEQLIKLTNSNLRRNRRILKTLCPEGKATVRKEVLDAMDYDYRCFSSIFRSKTTTYYLVYDFGFSPIMTKGAKKVLIVQRQDYMNQLGFEMWK